MTCLQCSKHAANATVFKKQYDQLLASFRAYMEESEEEIQALRDALSDCSLTHEKVPDST